MTTMKATATPGHSESYTRLINSKVDCQWWGCDKRAEWRTKDQFDVCGQKGVAFFYACEEHFTPTNDKEATNDT